MTPPPDLPAWLQQHGFADARQAARHGNTPLMHAAWRGEAARLACLPSLRAATRRAA